MRQRPSLISQFAGREEELDKMKTILDSYGSAAIMLHGAAEMTQLAVAFADRAEKSKWTPGGTFWIRASGSKNQLIAYLADFMEALTG